MSEIAPELLKILVCPETHQPVKKASSQRLEQLQARFQAGKLTNRKGEPVKEKFDGALVREDGAVAYLVIDSIPMMLIDEAIELQQLEEK